MKNPSLIVVDDDADTLDLFCDFLDMKDLDVIGKGRNGMEAFEMYKKLKPDIVLLDVMMPDFDGMFGLSKIKEFDDASKVIMVTADLTEKTAKKLNELKADDILYKPYEIEHVVKTIHEVLSRKQTPMIS